MVQLAAALDLDLDLDRDRDRDLDLASASFCATRLALINGFALGDVRPAGSFMHNAP